MQTSASPLPRHLPSLQYIRAVAAIAVVFYHSTIQVALASGSRVYPVIGASGVDIFFVLSGFVMWASTINKNNGIVDFLLRRVIRIVPLYWALTIFASSTALLMPNLLKSTTFSLPHFLASLLFIPWTNPSPGLFDFDRISPVVIPGWSLNLEMMFYLLFAFCLPFDAKRRPYLLSAALILLFAIGTLTPSGLAGSFYGNDMIFEFLAGVLIAAYVVPYLVFPAIWVVPILLLSIAAIIATEWSGLMFARSVGLGIPAMLIVASAVNLERLSVVPKWRLLEVLGDASYSIYLSHIFILAGLRVALRLAGLDLTGLTALAFVPMSVAVSIFIGWAIHEKVEKPLVKVANDALRGNRLPPDRAVLR